MWYVTGCCHGRVHAWETLLSLPNTSRIKTHQHPAVHAPKAPGFPQAREGYLSGYICKQNWLRMVGDWASEAHGSGSAVGQAWSEQPSVP